MPSRAGRRESKDHVRRQHSALDSSGSRLSRKHRILLAFTTTSPLTGSVGSASRPASAEDSQTGDQTGVYPTRAHTNSADRVIEGGSGASAPRRLLRADGADVAEQRASPPLPNLRSRRRRRESDPVAGVSSGGRAARPHGPQLRREPSRLPPPWQPHPAPPRPCPAGLFPRDAARPCR